MYGSLYVPAPLTTPFAGVKSLLPKMWIGARGVNPLAKGSEGENTQKTPKTKTAQQATTNKRLTLPERKVLKLFSFFTSLHPISTKRFLFRMY
jgi:hypothetical protein